MNFKNIALSLLLTVSSLFAISPVSGLTVGAPHNSGTTTNDASIDFTWTPPTGVAWYYYKLDTNSTNYDLVSAGGYSTLYSSGSSMTVTATANGSYYLHIVAVDGSNNTSAPAIVSVSSPIDITAGTVAMTTGGTFVGSKTVVLTGSETGTLYYTTNGSDVNTSSSPSVTYTTNPPSKTLTLGVTATIKTLLVDAAGNKGTQASTTYTLTNNPTVKTATGATIDGTTVATTTAGGATTTVTELDVNGTDLTRYQYKLDSASTYTNVGDMTTNIDISALSTGSHTVYVRGGDAYNYQTADTTVTFTVDNTAPASLKIKVNSIDANESNASTVTFADNFTFSLSSDDANASKRYTTDGSTPTKTTGTQYTTSVTTAKTVTTGSTSTFPIKFVAYDAAGNIGAVKSINFTIDKKAPVLTMPATQTFSSSFDVTMSTDDNTSTIYYLVSDSPTATIAGIKANGKTGTTATIGKNPTTNQDDGTYKYLHAIAVDKVGNGDGDSDIQTVTFTYSGNSKILTATSPVNVGSAATGSSVSKVITITNSGTNSITLTDANITVTGTDFNRTSTTCATTIASTGTCTVTVSLLPTSTGAKSGLLRLIYDGTASTDLNISLTGTGTNAAPTATYSSAITVDEDNVSNVILTGSDVDTNTSVLTFYKKSSDFNGTITVETNGSATVTPTANYNGSGWFTYYVYDGDKNSSEANVTINVTPVNDLPVITLSSDSIQANGGADGRDGNITFTATDVDGDEINGTVTVQGTKGLAAVSGSYILYDGNSSSAKGSDSFTVVFSDGHDGNVTKVISVAVANNIPHVQSAPDLNINEDNTSASGFVSTYDIDGDDILVTIDTNASHGTLTLLDNNISSDENYTSYTYVPTENYNGSDSFTLSFDDSYGGIVTQTINVTVNSVNDTPVLEGITLTNIDLVEDNGTTNYELNVSDVEGNDLNITVESNNTNIVTVSPSWNGLVHQADWNRLDFNLTTVSNANGMVQIKVIVNDGEANATTTYDVNVTAVNDAPVLTNPYSSGITKLEDFADFNVTLVATDVDDTNLTFSVDSNNTSIATVSVVGNILTVSGVANANGIVTIDVNVTDGDLVDSKSFNLTVSAVNDAPTFNTISDINTTEDNSSIGTIIIGATDVDSNITYSVDSNDTSIATVSVTTDGNLTITPLANANGIVTIDVNVTDGTNTTTKSFTLTLNAVDDAPTITPIDDINKSEDDSAFNVIVSANDVDGDAITYAATSSNPSIATVSISDNNLTITPIANAYGDVNITVTATANSVDVNDTFLVSIASVNDAPVINNIFEHLSYQPGNGIQISNTIEINATDVDTNISSLDINVTSSNTTIATVSFSGSEFNISTDTNVSGEASITVVVSDGNKSSTKLISVVVSESNFSEVGVDILDKIANSTSTEYVYSPSSFTNITSTPKKIINNDGTVEAETTLLNGYSATIKNDNNVTTYEVNTTTNTIKQTFNTSGTGIERELLLNVNDGNVSGKIKNENNVSTELSIKVDANVSASIKTNGSLETSFTISNKSVTIEVKETGKVTPTKVTNTATPKELPAGTNVTIFNDGTNNQMKFETTLDATNNKIEFN